MFLWDSGCSLAPWGAVLLLFIYTVSVSVTKVKGTIYEAKIISIGVSVSKHEKKGSSDMEAIIHVTILGKLHLLFNFSFI